MSEKKKPNPHAGHRNRMRERFLKEGGASFEKHELLELLLYNTIPMQNTNVIAHRLLDSFNNSLTMLINSDHRDIVEKGNVSTNTAVFLNVLAEMLKRCQKETLQQKVALNGIEKSGEYALNLLKYETTEKFLKEKNIIKVNNWKEIYIIIREINEKGEILCQKESNESKGCWSIKEQFWISIPIIWNFRTER